MGRISMEIGMRKAMFVLAVLVASMTGQAALAAQCGGFNCRHTETYNGNTHCTKWTVSTFYTCPTCSCPFTDCNGISYPYWQNGSC
jgi:hypothetical protein